MVLAGVPDEEDDRDFRIEAFDLLLFEIDFGPEGEAVDPPRQRGAGGQELADAAVLVRPGFADLPPALILADFKKDGHAARRPSPRGVQDVRCDAAHTRIFSSRRFVIFRCSSAATRSSVSGSLSSRARSRPSISSALLPVAQTMKMSSKRDSYRRFASASAVRVSASALRAPACSAS